MYESDVFVAKITRYKNIQIEDDIDLSFRIFSKVTWINDCEYLLTPLDNEISLKEARVKIVDFSENSYVQTSTVGEINFEYKSRVVKVSNKIDKSDMALINQMVKNK